MIAKNRHIRRLFHYTGQYLCGLVIFTQPIVDPAKSIQQRRLIALRQLAGQFLRLAKTGFIATMIGQHCSQVVGGKHIVRILHQETLVGSNSRIILLLPFLDRCQSKYKARLIR